MAKRTKERLDPEVLTRNVPPGTNVEPAKDPRAYKRFEELAKKLLAVPKDEANRKKDS